MTTEAYQYTSKLGFSLWPSAGTSEAHLRSILHFLPESCLIFANQEAPVCGKMYKVTANLVKCSHSPFTIWSFILCTLLKYLWPFKQQGWNNFRFLKCFRQHMRGQNPKFTQAPYRCKHLCINPSGLSPWVLWALFLTSYGNQAMMALVLSLKSVYIWNFQIHDVNISVGAHKTLLSLFCFGASKLCGNRAVRANPSLDRTVGSAASFAVFS